MGISDTEAGYWISFTRVEGLGAQRLKKIYAQFGSMEAAWRKGRRDDFLSLGIPTGVIGRFLKQRELFDPKEEPARIQAAGVSFFTFEDHAYPNLLKEIPDAPAFLYYRGDLSILHPGSRWMSVVGTRRMSAYGKQVVGTLVWDLVKYGVGIISGMALGVDGEAHACALEAGGLTVGVLPSGLDDASLYPRAHFSLAKRIIERGGLLLSEFPIGSLPHDYYFPFRNRIIAGLSPGTLVIEAPRDSGTTLTTKYALEYNREIFAVPNPIFAENAHVPNDLIKKGATPVESAKDILGALHWDGVTAPEATHLPLDLSNEETQIFGILTREPTHVDDIIRSAKLDTKTVLSTLSIMELRGIVKRVEGNQYIKL